MSEASNSYEKAITTERPAEMLAARHGFESLAQLADSLPIDARVLDVGAGASPFGREVALVRPDITWVNFDYSYNDDEIFNEVSRDAPANVEYIAGDATKLKENYEPETFDAVFSYWLLPHLSLDDINPASEAVRAMLDITKTGGLISVGPKASVSLKSGDAIQVIKELELNTEDVARRIAIDTQLSRAARSRQKFANEAATSFFGTSRYVKREGRVPKIFNPDTGEYVSIASSKGIKTAGSLAVHLVRYAHQHKQK